MNTEEQNTKIKELISKIQTAKNEKKGNRVDARKIYPIELKKDILSFHYESGRTVGSLALELNLAPQVINKWKRVHGIQRTGVIHGTTVRNDVRTKCLAVSKYFNNGHAVEIAEEYGVHYATVLAWVKQYKDKYLEYIDLPDGVTVIAREEKHVYGNENIKQVEELLVENSRKLTELLLTMHLSNTEREMLNKLKEKNEKKQTKLETLKEFANDLGLKIK